MIIDWNVNGQKNNYIHWYTYFSVKREHRTHKLLTCIPMTSDSVSFFTSAITTTAAKRRLYSRKIPPLLTPSSHLLYISTLSAFIIFFVNQATWLITFTWEFVSINCWYVFNFLRKYYWWYKLNCLITESRLI